MKSPLKNPSSIPPFFLRRLPIPKCICTQPQTPIRTEKITSDSSSLTQTHVIKALLSHKNDPLSALKYFRSVEKKGGFVESTDVVCVLLHILVDHLVDTSKRLDFELNSRAFNYLLNSYVRVNRIDDVVDCFNGMLERDVRRFDYGICDDACFFERREAEEFFREAKAQGIDLDAGVYSIAILAAFRKPDLNMAGELLREMQARGRVPSEGTFTTVIGAFVKQGNLAEALRLKDEMLSSGKPLNVVVATSLMKGYCKQGDINGALDLFNKIKEDGVAPNKVTYTVLIEWCCRNRTVEKAYELYEEMKTMGLQPTGFNVNSLIRGFLEARSLNEASSLFDEAVESGIATVYTYNIFLYHFSKDGKVKEACGLWQRMVTNGLVPSNVMNNNVILAYCKVQNMDMAHTTFSEMIERGFKPNAITYSMLIDVHFSKGDAERALDVFYEMVGVHIALSDYTFNIIVNGLSKVGWCAMDSALRVYREMCESGISPNVITYTSMVNGLCKSDNMDLALKMHYEMKSKGLQLDVTAFNALIDGFCKKRDMVRAVSFFPNSGKSGYLRMKSFTAACKLFLASGLYSEMLTKGIVPDIVTYTVLLNGLYKKGQLQNAHKILKEMDRQGLTSNVLIYNALIAGHFREGNLEEASRLHNEMLDRGLLPDDTTYDILVNGKAKGENHLSGVSCA
ncbi:Detected protein of unknown function [Hibiscus syriacus]|uniref:PROP1-like PPR domain-containing protein n=1 Tax=Hibiscus syriacus TaxID=106335 RepID=A0A6A2ZG26_HIBSY|nr:Detected protein of unknown function [Hibiscus syriacus]